MSTDAQHSAKDPYEALQETPDFQDLRKKFRGWVFPVTALFLAWYFLYVLLSTFAAEFMGTFVFGKITVGLLFGLSQFVTTFIITYLYARWADRVFDPAADKLAAELDDITGGKK